jgi:hypothetical protein
MRKLLFVLLALPSLSTAQLINGYMEGYNREIREQQEREIRRLQIEAMKRGERVEVPATRQSQACRRETFTLDVSKIICTVCPGKQATDCMTLY